MMHGGFFHGWWMPLGWILGLIILITVIWLINRALNQNQSSSPTSQRSALDILKERYARGEISKEEYMEKKNDLV
jgi:putative membrane protein